MRPRQLKEALKFAIQYKLPMLIKGGPGVGKSEICAQAAEEMGAKLIISHPVVSDPTDFKGLPYPVKGKEEAKFLPFGDLLQLIKADKPTVYFLDDLGQAPMSVQASCMQLLLARRVNGHIVSDYVVFLAATNRRQDRAGVQGILEPVKSRFASIVELEVNTDDWVDWAIKNDMPAELIAFIRFRPELLNKFDPTGDIKNTPNPRTVAYVGTMINRGMPSESEYELIAGAVGEGFSAEFTGFQQTWRDLPDIDKLIKDPDNADVPEEPSSLYAICGAIASRATVKKYSNIMRYTERLPAEFQVLLIKDSVQRKKSLTNTEAFTKWARRHSDIIL